LDRPRPQLRAHDRHGRGEDGVNTAMFSPTSLLRCSNGNISVGLGNNMVIQTTELWKLWINWKILSCQNPDDSNQFGLWNVSWFWPPNTTDSLRIFYWILSP
jgi:hypothetical protein